MIVSSALERVFNRRFAADYQTILVGGGIEPVYQPSGDLESEPHRIVYLEDFVASALHEVAHWCLAGARRRGLEDYGYWYTPDGRSRRDQEAFERVEVDPQALEWVFSDACGFVFNLSADNLMGDADARASSERFARAVLARKERYLVDGLPVRADTFRRALQRINSSPRTMPECP